MQAGETVTLVLGMEPRVEHINDARPQYVQPLPPLCCAMGGNSTLCA